LVCAGRPSKQIFCYFSSSSHARPGAGKFWPENIDPFLCTHVIFAFVDIQEGGAGLKPNSWDDIGEHGLYARTVALKEKNPDLKVLLAVGGWKIGSEPFLPIIESRESWMPWIHNVVHYLRKHGFDGFDMDWEFPGWRGSGPEDRHKFTLFMKDIYQTFAEESEETGQDRLLLTLAAASSAFYSEKAYEQWEIHKYVDYLLVMTYNYHGSGWEMETAHHAALLPHHTDPEGEQQEFHVLWSIKYWLEFGVPREKVIVGLPTYGLGWKLTDPHNTGVRAPADGGTTRGKYTGESGILSHFEICEHIHEDGWTVKWIDEQKAPYAYGDNEWVGFDSPDSFYVKARTIEKLGLGGAFIWSLEMDDFTGHCGGPKYPLLRTVHQVFAGHHDHHGHDHDHDDLHDYNMHHDYDHDHDYHHDHESYEHVEESWEEADSRYHHEDDHVYDYEHTYLKDIDCDSLGEGIHPDPASCYYFILCTSKMNGTALGAQRMMCPDGTLFDTHSKICDFEHNVECHLK